jgi:hypothetical protein
MGGVEEDRLGTRPLLHLPSNPLLPFYLPQLTMGGVCLLTPSWSLFSIVPCDYLSSRRKWLDIFLYRWEDIQFLHGLLCDLFEWAFE